MIKRLIQRTTRGSYFIFIPKHLVESIGIKKGSEVGIEYKHKSIIMTPVSDVLVDKAGTGVETTHPEVCADEQ